MSQYDDPATFDDPRGDALQRGPRLREGRGTTVLVLGILGLVVCFICGIIAWSMGASDLKEMRAGRMDRRQESETRIGMILGIIATILAGLGVIFVILMFAGFIALGNKVVDESKPGGFFDRMARSVEQSTVRAELLTIGASIDAYQSTNGKLPASLKDLRKKSDTVPIALSSSDITDPWNHEYDYTPQGGLNYRLSSRGPDGQPDSEDDIVHEK